MKTFIYTQKEKKGRYSNYITLSIYRIIKNKPIYLGDHKYNTGMTKGEASEIYDFLRLKNLAKKSPDGYAQYDDYNLFKV